MSKVAVAVLLLALLPACISDVRSKHYTPIGQVVMAAFDSNDKISLVYYSGDKAAQRTIRFASRNNGKWDIHDVFKANEPYENGLKLANDNNNTPHIACCSIGENGIKYAYFDKTSKEWFTEMLVADESVTAVDFLCVGGAPFFVFRNELKQLKYMYREKGRWISNIIDHDLITDWGFNLIGTADNEMQVLYPTIISWKLAIIKEKQISKYETLPLGNPNTTEAFLLKTEKDSFGIFCLSIKQDHMYRLNYYKSPNWENVEAEYKITHGHFLNPYKRISLNEENCVNVFYVSPAIGLNSFKWNFKDNTIADINIQKYIPFIRRILGADRVFINYLGDKFAITALGRSEDGYSYFLYCTFFENNTQTYGETVDFED